MKKLTFLSLITAFILTSHFAIAAETSYALLEPLPSLPGVTNNDVCKTGPDGKTIVRNDENFIRCMTVSSFISYVFKFAIALAVFLAIFMVIWGGFQYMLSDVPYLKLDAKSKFTNAAMGLAAVLLSYLFLQTIDPRLVQVTTTIPPVCPKGQKAAPGSPCNPEEAIKFQTQLEKDLRQLNTQRLGEVVELEDKIQLLAREILTIENQLKSSAIDEETSIDKTILLQKKKLELQGLKSEQIQLTAVGTAENNFRNALEGYHAKGAFDSEGKIAVPSALGVNFDEGGTASNNAERMKQSISTLYNKYINNPAIANDPAAKDRLITQSQFYRKEIDEEEVFMSAYTRYKNTPEKIAISRPITGDPRTSTPSYSTANNPKYPIAKKEVQDLLVKYKNQYTTLTSTSNTTGNDFLSKVKKDPILLQQNKTLLEDRIKLLESVVEPPPAPINPNSSSLRPVVPPPTNN